MEEATKIVTKREMSQRADKERERGGGWEKGGNMNENDEGYLPASQDATPTVWLYMVHTDSRFDFSHMYRLEAFIIYK